ncbi:MAG: molybdopterin-guanine dinucleotide biosynthesis protein B [Desulfobulbus sp.]|jgi:molybdopterin-guanine dinucleotide biosynthesis protein B
MPFLIAFIGWHNSGKTTVAAQVASLLHKKGFRVGVLKSTKETGLEPERPTSDTSRYRQAGAVRVALAAPDELIVRSDALGREPLELARRFFADLDFVLVEGFKSARGLPKIEVRREGIAEPAIFASKAGAEVIAVVCDTPLQGPLPSFRSTEIDDIVRFLENLRRQHYAQLRCSLQINGREFPVPPALAQELHTLLASYPEIAQALPSNLPALIAVHCRIPAQDETS